MDLQVINLDSLPVSDFEEIQQSEKIYVKVQRMTMENNSELNLDADGEPLLKLSELPAPAPPPEPPKLSSSASDIIMLDDVPLDDNFGMILEENFDCSICTEPVHLSQMFFVDSCGHMFCVECVTMYCRTKIVDGDLSIKCPDRDCSELITYQEIKHLIEDDSDLDGKYEKFLFDRALESLGDIVWCPIPHCQQPIPTNRHFTEIKCIKCSFIFCVKCKEQTHDGFTCEQFKKYGGKIDTFEVWLEIKGSDVKQCPECRYYTEKIGGCASIVCAKCKKKYCWLCSTLISLGDNHYNVPQGCINTYVPEEKKDEWKKDESNGAPTKYTYFLDDSEDSEDYEESEDSDY